MEKAAHVTIQMAKYNINLKILLFFLKMPHFKNKLHNYFFKYADELDEFLFFMKNATRSHLKTKFEINHPHRKKVTLKPQIFLKTKQ